ncbi:MAG: hypothetical protein DRJ03_22340 [Chloroflexi bacterium]|nr:MAG: hypothetical protein DRJ03_22340 [Chloroflexota bacterium]
MSFPVSERIGAHLRAGGIGGGIGGGIEGGSNTTAQGGFAGHQKLAAARIVDQGIVGHRGDMAA